MSISQTDLLFNSEAHLEQASTGKRFANYLIDVFLFYIIAIIIGVVIAVTNPATLESLAENETSAGFNFLDSLISLVFYAVYMGIFESLTKGRSLGKLITGTKAVNEDGSTISTQTAFIRGFSRAVPFCVFSALGSPSYPWHDRWSNTYVIDIKNSTIPQDSF